MKAEINESGMLTIKAETPLEAYALQKWTDYNLPKIDCENICISINYREIENESRK